MIRVKEMTMKKQNANGVWQVEAGLIADTKEEVGEGMSVSGLPSNSELILGSYVITATGSLGIIDSEGTWHWVGEDEDAPAATLSMNRPNLLGGFNPSVIPAQTDAEPLEEVEPVEEIVDDENIPTDDDMR